MTTKQSGREAFSPEAIAAFRREKGSGMTSAVGEYTPSEFWDALDEIERLQAALAQQGPGEAVAERQAWISAEMTHAEVAWTESFGERFANGDDVPDPNYFVSLWLAERMTAPKQQGREVGLPHSYTASVLTTIAGGAPSVTFHFDDVDEAEAWHKRITDAAPKQQAVSEADIYWLREQVRHDPLSHSFIKDEKRCEVCKRLAKIDAALLAALPGKTEVE